MNSGHHRDQDTSLQIRWLIRRDMPEVLAIEQESFDSSWSEEEFLSILRQRNCIGMVAEVDHEIVGFMIYELHKSNLHVLNFAVAREHRHRGIGARMVQRLVDKLSLQRRREILLEVRERNLEAQLFFKSQNFVAVSVLRNHYEDTCEDAYQMRYQLQTEAIPMIAGSTVNRLTAYYDADAA